MGVEVDMRGIDAALKQLAGEETKVRNVGLKKAAQAIAERLRENTPIDHKSHNKKHMKDDVSISGVDQYGEVTVGYGKDTYWRAHFLEIGTIKIRPKGFIQRTEEEMKNEVMRIMEEEFKRGLGL